MDWIANSLTRIILNEIGRDKIDKILGVPTAGVPFATVVSQKLGIPLIYYRQARKEHGVRKKIEGILDRYKSEGFAESFYDNEGKKRYYLNGRGIIKVCSLSS
jgi:adenine/guanine phosphoribosyltransferase-like PRPP-binding protein